MARTQKTPLDKLDKAIMKILTDYADEISENADEVTVKMGRKGAAALRQESAADFGGTGRYAKGWTVQVDRHRLYTDVIIYNRTPGLPHLLEHGHLMRNGRRWTPPKQHIEPIEQKLVTEYEKEVLSKI